MLISWRSRHEQQTEITHPDPSLVRKWSKLYDDNPGISNKQIADFADDLGLKMLEPITPTPIYIRDVLRRHGPLWVNGRSHITVIAGIRTSFRGCEVLVFDPAKPELIHGEWKTFEDVYFLNSATRLDAGTDSQTPMLYLWP